MCCKKPRDSSLVSYKVGILWYSQLQIAPLQAPPTLKIFKMLQVAFGTYMSLPGMELHA